MSVSRITSDLDTSQILGPLSIIAAKFKKLPLPSLYDAVQPLIDDDILPGLDTLAKSYYSQVLNAKKPGGCFEHDPLSADCIAALKLYSSEDLDPPLYKDLNTKCYHPDRRSVRPYAKFLLLLHHSLKMISPYNGAAIYRGVKKDLRGAYYKGREVTWQGLTSCTTNIEVLNTPPFLGTSGGGTMFIIELSQRQARSISKYSVIPGEDEVLLPAGSKFEVVGNFQHDALTSITLREVKSDDIFMDLQAPLAESLFVSTSPAKVWTLLPGEGQAAQEAQASASVPAPAPAKATASKAPPSVHAAVLAKAPPSKAAGSVPAAAPPVAAAPKAALAAPVDPAASAAAAADAMAKFLGSLSPAQREQAHSRDDRRPSPLRSCLRQRSSSPLPSVIRASWPPRSAEDVEMSSPTRRSISPARAPLLDSDGRSAPGAGTSLIVVPPVPDLVDSSNDAAAAARSSFQLRKLEAEEQLASERRRGEISELRREVAGLLRANRQLHVDLRQLNVQPPALNASMASLSASAIGARDSINSGISLSSGERGGLEVRVRQLEEECRQLGADRRGGVASASAAPTTTASRPMAADFEHEDLHRQLRTVELARAAAESRLSTAEPALANAKAAIDQKQKPASSLAAFGHSNSIPSGGLSGGSTPLNRWLENESDNLRQDLREAEARLEEFNATLRVKTEEAQTSERRLP